MATNTNPDVGRGCLGHIAIRTRANFKARYLPLSSSLSTEKACKNRLISPTAWPNQSSIRTVSCTGACLQEELIPQ
ncbi:hypothetical protein TNCV_4769441 [Trichonephila clavipes]|nr:hypothetical protein TNCV_4769441 [Trichonephila clavipes]